MEGVTITFPFPIWEKIAKIPSFPFPFFNSLLALLGVLYTCILTMWRLITFLVILIKSLMLYISVECSSWKTVLWTVLQTWRTPSTSSVLYFLIEVPSLQATVISLLCNILDILCRWVYVCIFFSKPFLMNTDNKCKVNK